MTVEQNVSARIRDHVGGMTLEVIRLQTELEAKAVPGAAWEALAECIRSGQVREEKVPGLLAADPAFAAWYLEVFSKAE